MYADSSIISAMMFNKSDRGGGICLAWRKGVELEIVYADSSIISMKWKEFSSQISMLLFSGGKMAIAGVVRDHSSAIVWAKTLVGNSPFPLVAADAEAARMSCFWVYKESWDIVIMEGDAQTFIKSIRNEAQLPHWSTMTYLQDIKNILTSHPRWSFAFVPRQANRVAYEMAAWALKNDFSGTLESNKLPFSIRKVVEMESAKNV